MNRTKFFHYQSQISLSLNIILICLTFFTSQLFSQLANGHDKFLGCGQDPVIPGNFNTYWNQITPGNAGKWGSVEPSRDIYLWNNLDIVYDYAYNVDFPFKHHTLIWGQQQPSWINSLDSLGQAQEVEEWIQLVAQRYPEADFVDVVNEPLLFHGAQPSYKNALGGDGETGWDWVIWAFEKARQYFPDSTQLILNEYHILNSNYYTSLLVDLVNLLIVRDLIDAIGIEGHSFELQYVSVPYMENNLNTLAALGLPIYISEFDVNFADDTEQLEEYQRVFPFLWEHPAVKGITLWGYIQGQMWSTTPNAYLIRSDGTERPAMQWLRTYLASQLNIDDSPQSFPTDFTLYQNYPNPFNPSTTIEYTLRYSSKVTLIIYNVKGEKIRTLIDTNQSIGQYKPAWDARDDQNNPVSSGVYFYRLTTDNGSLQKKMVLLR
jgi:endo-1,4-beta-xylanase